MSASPLEPTPQPRTVPVSLNSSRVVAEMTPTEYHAFQRTANDKYEYMDGKVIQMPGASPEHNFIQIDFIRSLGNLLEEAGISCDVTGSDQKIYVSPSRYYLADAVVICGEGQFDFEDCLRNPILVTEVLSPSTGFFDREDKFRDYRRLESLTHYVLIRQDIPSVTHYEKGTNGLWTIVGDYSELTESLELTLGGATIAVPLSRIYRRIDFSAPVTTDAPS